ncbi:hypothetical protein ACHAXS_003001 [Conticribra weissflogii]
MVKFGRHVDFFVANDLDPSRRLYVVPYKEIQHKTCVVSSSSADDCGCGSSTANDYETTTNQSNDEDIISSSNSEDHERDLQAEAHFLSNRFETEWRICLKRASVDFDRAMRTFWGEVFDGISSSRRKRRQRSADDSATASKGGGGQDEKKEHDRDTNVIDNNGGDLADIDDADDEAVRGALPDAALQMYVSSVPSSEAQELFSFLKDIHATALINAEALRKLVKKFDKLHNQRQKNNKNGKHTQQGQNHGHVENYYYEMLSTTLLPEVYSSNFTMALASLEAGLTLLRVLLNIDDDEDALLTTAEENRSTKSNNHNNNNNNEPTNILQEENQRLQILAANNDDIDDDLRFSAVLTGGYLGNKKDTDAALVQRRKEELQWLRSLVLESIDPVYIPFLVAHRGFHSIHDRSDVRPLENSLMAYEAAWTNGIHLCECDIALTKDERIILAHDENFARLGMDPSSPLCNRTVRDLTFQELMNCPLKSGARPPLLFDVLRSAAAIGEESKLIVEIKAGNSDAVSALARMFVRHPQLMEHVAVVMSFDAFIMHNLRREMGAVFEQLYGGYNNMQLQQHTSPTAANETTMSFTTSTFATSTTTAPIHIPTSKEECDNAVNSYNDSALNTPSYHPLKSQNNASLFNVRSQVCLGGTLSTSPMIKPEPIMPTHSHTRMPSHTRFPSLLGGHARADSFGGVLAGGGAGGNAVNAFGTGGSGGFGISHNRFDSRDHFGLGLSINNLTDMDSTTSTATSFLPLQRSGSQAHQRVASNSNMQKFYQQQQQELNQQQQPPYHHHRFQPQLPDKELPPQMHRNSNLNPHQRPTLSFPKLLLITVAEPPKQDYELHADITDPNLQSRLENWLRGRDGGSLDGVYMQFQKAMISEPEAAEAMRALASQFDLGIWGANPKPDDWETFHRLVTECHVSFVNTGLPKNFMRKVKRSASVGNIAGVG